LPSIVSRLDPLRDASAVPVAVARAGAADEPGSDSSASLIGAPNDFEPEPDPEPEPEPEPADAEPAWLGALESSLLEFGSFAGDSDTG